MDALDLAPAAKTAKKYKQWYHTPEQRENILNEGIVESSSEKEKAGPSSQKGHGLKKSVLNQYYVLRNKRGGRIGRVSKVGKGVTFYKCSNPNRLKKNV